LWVADGDARISTLDRLQRRWVLLSQDERWADAVAEASERLGVEVELLLVGRAIVAPLISPRALTVDTPIEQIALEAGGKAALDVELPMLTPHAEYARFKSMSLRELQPVSRGLITDAILAKLGAALAAVRCQPKPADPAQFRSDVEAAFGIAADGASLVRPDGYVAWRSRGLPSEPTTALTNALTRVAFATR
jgi:hypothetical protein